VGNDRGNCQRQCSSETLCSKEKHRQQQIRTEFNTNRPGIADYRTDGESPALNKEKISRDILNLISGSIFAGDIQNRFCKVKNGDDAISRIKAREARPEESKIIRPGCFVGFKRVLIAEREHKSAENKKEVNTQISLIKKGCVKRLENGIAGIMVKH